MIRLPTLTLILSALLYRLVSAKTISEDDLAQIKDGHTVIGWVLESPNRGSLAIITSCSLTMGLCIWTALHLNIPAAHESTARVWGRNLNWTLIGLLAPELVVYQAWRQWIAANALKRMVNKCLKQDAKTSGDPEKGRALTIARTIDFEAALQKKSKHETPEDDNFKSSKWHMIHGFYGVMGGFTFDAETVRACGIEPAVPMTLTPRGVALLVKCGIVPFIPANDIEDKSKADGMAKLLVCIQAGYMLIQAVARKIENLAITQLEFNTLGHVICALFIYVLWWRKPWTIYSATTLQGDWTSHLCTYMYMSSKVSIQDEFWDMPIWRIYMKRTGKPELDRLRFANKTSNPVACEPGDALASHPPSPKRSVDVSEQSLPIQSDLRNLASNYLSPIAESFRAQLSPRSAIARTISRTTSKTTVVSHCEPGQSSALPSDDSENAYVRYRFFVEAMEKYPELASRTRSAKSQTTERPGPFETEELLVAVASNWPADAVLVSDVRGVVMGMALWFASMAFGAVHAAAWNDYFPTALESWLWRGSSLYIVWSGLLWLSINCLGLISAKFDQLWDHILAGKAKWYVYVMLALLCSTCGIAYGFARVYLVVESWVSLRDLPKSAFFTPKWEPLLPHF